MCKASSFLNLFFLLLFCSASSFNIDAREPTMTIFNFTTVKGTGEAPEYAGYNFLASVNLGLIRLVAGAPAHRSSSGSFNGALFVCGVDSKRLGRPSDWPSDVICHKAINVSSLEVGANHLQRSDFFGTTLVSGKEGSSTREYVVCAPGREKKCGSSGTYLPGACYSGTLNGSFHPLEGWGEVRCFESYLDVLFLIDSSFSISSSDFEIMKRILIDTSAVFTDSLGESTQIGILQYGQQDPINLNYLVNNPTYYINPTKLGDCDDVTCLQAAINNNMRHLMSGDTYTAHAIKRAVHRDFNASRNRLLAKKILVLITDGEATDEDELRSSYELTRRNNITVYAIGVGNHVTRDQLKISANGGVSDERVLTPENYDALSRQLQNLTREISRTSAEGHGGGKNALEFAQFGFSGHTTKKTDALFLGVVGAYHWSGTVAKYNPPSIHAAEVLNFTSIQSLLGNDSENSLFGYTITTGYYEGGEESYVAVSAPKFRFRGAVFVYKQAEHSGFGRAIRIFPNCSAPSCFSSEHESSYFLGSYFGGSLLSVDVNGDNKTDLLVGAPLYTKSSYDEGRVFVYITKEKSSSLKIWSNADGHSDVGRLTGDDGEGGRFGMAMAAAGDINIDGYNDVIIGAPYAEEGRGAIYVYYGGKNGIRNEVKQKISASNFKHRQIFSFGFSLQGGIDFDRNSFPDVLVGAPQSDVIVLLRTRPIANIQALLYFDVYDVDVLNCFNRPIRDCLRLTACFTANGTSLETSIEIIYGIVLDHPLNRIYFRSSNNSLIAKSFVQKRNILVSRTKRSCQTFDVLVQPKVENLSSPVGAVMSYNLSGAHLKKSLSSITTPGRLRRVSTATSFRKGCRNKGFCQLDLQISAALQLPQEDLQNRTGDKFDSLDNTPTLIVDAKTAKQSIKIVVNWTNFGDVAFTSRLILTYPAHLAWIQVSNISASDPGSSDCVIDEQKESRHGSVKSKTLSYSYNHFLGNIFPPKAWCSFKCELSLRNLGIQITSPNISIHLEARAKNDNHKINKQNNKKTLVLSVKYRADVGVSRTNEESLVTLSQTKSSVTIDELVNIKEKQTNVIQQFQVKSFGFSRIPISSTSLRYPVFLGTNHSLLRLIKVNCSSIAGNFLCSCDHGNANNECVVGGNIHPSVSFTQKMLDCSAAHQGFSCGILICNFIDFDPGDVIQVTASFELCSATFRPFNENSTEVLLRSGFEFSSQNSPHVLGHDGSSPITQSTKFDVTVQQIAAVAPRETQSLILLYVVGGSGGILLFLPVVAILFKIGFFKRKSYKVHQNPLKHEIKEGKKEIFENIENDPLS